MRRLWSAADGKKSLTGVVLTLGALLGYRWELLPADLAGGLLVTGLTTLAGGLAHKAVKRRRRKVDPE